MAEQTLYKSKRQRHQILRSALKNEVSSYISHWRTIARFVRPRRGRFDITDVNKGDRRNRDIIDATASTASRTLRAGMMAGVTSPARKWFHLTVDAPEIADNEHVKEWCNTVSERMTYVFEKSNLYQCLPIVYGDMGDFGIGAVLVEEDLDTVIRLYPFAVGSYMIALDDRLKVAVFFREFRLSVRQLIMKFGKRDKAGNIDWSNFSSAVKTSYDNGQLEVWIDVCHVIEPNPDFDSDKSESKYKKYLSCYYERGGTSSSMDNDTSDDSKYLREAGYDYFPVLAPRWEVTDEGAYPSDCPGMLALGDIQQLQHGEKTGMKALEKMVNPPVQGGPEFQNKAVSLLPGALTVTTGRDGHGLKAIHEVNYRVDLQEQKQDKVRERIKRAYMEDVFLAFTDSDRRQITATEITERKEEKLVAIGPTLSQLNQDLLDPLIVITYQLMELQGRVPPLPDELKGKPIKIEYVSIMAQAQKLLGIAGLERFSSYAQAVLAVYPEAKDKINPDEMLEVYADSTSVNSKIIRSDEEVAQIRQQAAAAQAKQQQLQNLQQGAQTAQTLSQTDTGGDNALTRLIQQGQAGNMVPQR